MAKAKILKARLGSRSNGSAPTDFAAHKEAEVMAEMDSILESSRLVITEQTLSFVARSSGVLFPALLNLGALLLVLALGTFFLLRLNQDEISLVNRRVRTGSAEGLIIEALQEASEAELSRKESQIVSIQGMLKEAEATRAALIEDLEKERSQQQETLRLGLQQELEAERQRLLAQGFSEAVISSRTSDLEKQKQGEYEARLLAMNADFDRQLERRSAEYLELVENHRRSLAQAQEEQDSMKRLLEQQQARSAQASQQALETMGADRSAALIKLEDLGRQQENAKLIEGRIQSLYALLNTRLKQNDYQGALAELDRLEEFLGSVAARQVASVVARLDTEQFLVDSLRRLINYERMPDSPDRSMLDQASSAQLVLDAVTSRVKEGNRLYADGKLEAAKAEYTAALIQIPQLEEGYVRLQELASRQLSQEKALVEGQLAEAARLYRNQQYQASVDRYRQALGYLEKGNPGVSSMLNDVLDAGYRLRTASEPPPAPVIVREELSLEEKDLLQKARASANHLRILHDTLDKLRANYAAVSGHSRYTTSQENMVSLLNAKLLLRRALSNKEIRRENPGLYETLDMVFDTYGREQQAIGRTEALQDLISLTDFLSRPLGTAGLPSFNAEQGTRQRDLLLEFLENLQILLDLSGHS